MLSGLVMIFISIKMSKAEEISSSINNFEVEGSIRAIDTSVKEANQASDKLTKLSKDALEEFDQKYQEILFLYSLMDEKKKDIAEIYNKPIVQDVQAEVPKPSAPQDTSSPKQVPSLIKNPNLPQILKLRDDGADVAEIAKTLGMGQGEVQLILGLEKR